MKTKIFLDSGDPKETKQALSLLGFLDGQTTNPSLITKNPEVMKLKSQKGKLTSAELLEFYKTTVQEISSLLPHGSVSVEIYAEEHTHADEIFNQANEMSRWIPNAHIKFPVTKSGLVATEKFVKNGGRANLTLVFSQAQAAAVYTATVGAKKGQIFLSPFIGRLDDRGENGLGIIQNIQKMYTPGDGHVEILAASVRTLHHFLSCLALKVDIITAPLKILQEWHETGQLIPEVEFEYNPNHFKEIPYQTLKLSETWQSFDLYHPLTDTGLEKFVSDWNGLLK